MAQLNAATKAPPVFTNEGTVARRITPLQELIRLTMTCMLWEDNFYENGVSVADRIKELVHKVTLKQSYGVAVEARNNMKLRHVPLLIVREMARHPKKGREAVGDNAPMWISITLSEVIQRPDELTEFLAIYWKEGKCPLSKQAKLGLAKAFAKFNEYQLAKYNRDKDIKLRDVLFLCHSKPKDVPAEALPWDKGSRGCYAAVNEEAYRTGFLAARRPNGFSEGELLYGKLIYDQLETPDTWEVELSQSSDKKTSWMRLLAEQKLGDLAFLRNLRNMQQAGVPLEFIVANAEDRKWGRVLPFRFIAAAQVVPMLEIHIERWMFKCLEGSPKLEGRTAIVIDTSPSMWDDKISAKSELSRFDAAAALAILLREVCEDVNVYAFNQCAYVVPPRRGFALRDALAKTKGNYSAGGTAVKLAGQYGYDRIVVLTDGQWHPDNGAQACSGILAVAKNVVPAPLTDKAYLIDVSVNRNSVGHRQWLTIDGWSEAVVDYIQAHERSAA